MTPSLRGRDREPAPTARVSTRGNHLKQLTLTERHTCWNCERVTGAVHKDWSLEWRICYDCDVMWCLGTPLYGVIDAYNNLEYFDVGPNDYMDLSGKDALTCP